MDTARNIKGIGAILLSCVFFAATSVLIKKMPDGVDGFFISFVRFAIGVILSLAALRALKRPLAVKDPKTWILRGVTGAAAMISTYIAIRVTSSGRAILLSDTYPVFVVLFGAFLFREKIFFRHLLSLTICTAGIVLVFFDATHYPLYGNLLGLNAGICGGLAVHFIRRSGAQNNSFIVYLSACLFGAVATSFSLFHIPSMPVYGWLVLCGVGFFAFTGQIVMTWGYKHISAAGGSIAGLAEIPATVCASAIFLNEQMTMRFLLGGAVIIAGLAVSFAGNGVKEDVVEPSAVQSKEGISQ